MKSEEKIIKGSYEIKNDKIIMKLKDETNDLTNGYGIYKVDGNKLTIKVNERGEEDYRKITMKRKGMT